MSYQGEIIGTIEGMELRRLTAEERRGGPQYYCLVGLTHWNPASFFQKLAADAERDASRLRTAISILAMEPT
jgi:hypothetical protein